MFWFPLNRFLLLRAIAQGQENHMLYPNNFSGNASVKPVASFCAEVIRNADSLPAIRLFLPSCLKFQIQGLI